VGWRAVVYLHIYAYGHTSTKWFTSGHTSTKWFGVRVSVHVLGWHTPPPSPPRRYGEKNVGAPGPTGSPNPNTQTKNSSIHPSQNRML
jgi:hypothetical protein